MSKESSLEYLIGLSKISGRSFNQTINRLVALLPEEDKPIQFVRDKNGNLVDVHKIIELHLSPKKIGFIP